MKATSITEALSIDGPSGELEAVLETPRVARGDAVAVICHPHPLYHGTMNNKVVHTLVRSFNLLGCPAVRFNFRGVGGSAGRYDEGLGETDDALAVVDWAAERWPESEVWLGGFSFGSYVALRAAVRSEPPGLIMVAPPVQRFAVAAEAVPRCPWLIVQGEDDELVDSSAVADWAAALSPPPALVVLDDTDHFFHGRLTRLRNTVQGFLGPYLGTAGSDAHAG
jgi:alpha/beta superfamily hydrolase